MSKFKIGDRVYCPTLGTGVYTLDISLSGDDFIVRADISKYHYVNEDGRLFSSDLLPHIFHVTEENRKKLEDLYGLEFEKQEPEMMKVGNFEFPKPESEPLKEGEEFYTPDINSLCFYEHHFWHDKLITCHGMLSKGLVHKTMKAAIQHAKVLIGISQGRTSEHQPKFGSVAWQTAVVHACTAHNDAHEAYKGK